MIEPVECPHCYGRVIAMPDGECPSCRKNTQEPTETNRHRFCCFVDATLPDNCIVCGEWTTRREKIQHYASTNVPGGPGSDGLGGEQSALQGLLRLAFLPFGVFGLIFQLILRDERQKQSAHTTKLTIKVPKCRNCRTTETKALNADHIERFVVIAAHQDFIAAFDELEKRLNT